MKAQIESDGLRFGEAEPVQLIAAADTAGAKGPRKFEGIAYTGGELQLSGFDLPVVVDLAGLQTAKAVSANLHHDRKAIVGHVTAVENDGKQIVARGVVSGSGASADEFTASHGNGFPWQISIEAKPHKIEEIKAGKPVTVNGRTFKGPLLIVRSSKLFGLAFVPLGADENTQVSLAAGSGGEIHSFHRGQTMKSSFDLDGINGAAEELTADLEAAFDAHGGEVRDANRLAEIKATAATAAAGLKNKAIRREWTEDDFDAAAAKLVATTTKNLLLAQLPQGPAIHSSSRDLDGQTIEAALCLRTGQPESFVGKQFNEQTMNQATSKQFRNFGLHALLAMTIEAAGRSVPRFAPVNSDFIRTAFEADRAVRAGGFSTLSLPGILSNVAGKSMLAGYMLTPTTWREFCAIGSNKDFKPATRWRLSGIGQYEELPPDGELHHVQLSEGSFQTRVHTEGCMFALTRTDIINDDLGAFDQVPKILGRMAAVKIEKSVYTLLLSNPSNFFHNDNGNFLSDALSIDALTAAEMKFLEQVDDNGDPTLVPPRLLLVPPALAVPAAKLVRDTTVVIAGDTDRDVLSGNPHAGRFKNVVSPWLSNENLTGNSDAGWYLLAAPSDGDIVIMEVSFLNGMETPTVESAETDFNTLGVQFRSYHDFGAAMRDHRGGVFSEG